MPDSTNLRLIRNSEIPRRNDVPDYRCRTCQDTGFAPSGDGRVRRCDCVTRKALEERAYAEGVPVEFHEALLANYRPIGDGNHLAIEGARDFLAADSGDLYIAGLVGCGKTRLACSILNDWYRKRLTGLFANVPLMLEQLQPKPKSEAEEQSEYERKLINAPVLVLDDVGAERDHATDFTRRTLLMLCEARWAANRRTIWTSNKTLGELAEMQDDARLPSRIVGRATAVWINVPDQRLHGGDAA